VEALDSKVLISCKRLSWVDSRLRKMELQQSNFEWTMEAAMVEAVLKSDVGGCDEDNECAWRKRLEIWWEKDRWGNVCGRWEIFGDLYSLTSLAVSTLSQLSSTISVCLTAYLTLWIFTPLPIDFSLIKRLFYYLRLFAIDDTPHLPTSYRKTVHRLKTLG